MEQAGVRVSELSAGARGKLGAKSGCFSIYLLVDLGQQIPRNLGVPVCLRQTDLRLVGLV